jgi:hypothetical protein
MPIATQDMMWADLYDFIAFPDSTPAVKQVAVTRHTATEDVETRISAIPSLLPIKTVVEYDPQEYQVRCSLNRIFTVLLFSFFCSRIPRQEAL